MKPLGVNMGAVKSQNRGAIIKYLSKVGPASRKDVAEAIGLTPASVTQITTVLLEEGIIWETGRVDDGAKAGRKKVLIDINYNFAYIFSINIEVEKTTIAVTNLGGQVCEISQMVTDKEKSPEDFLKSVGECCLQLKAKLSKEVQTKTRGAVVGIPGIVDKENGLSKHAYGIWSSQVDVCGALEKILELPCYIENNVNAFALATMFFGEGRSQDNLHIIKWGPGVGSAIIIDNAIYEGHRGKAAELGHVIVDSKGQKCSCGRIGCLETKVSYGALNKIKTFEPYRFAEAYEGAKDDAKKSFDEAIELFATTIVNSMSLLAPNQIILTGFLFVDSKIRDKVIALCRQYDPRIGEELIEYSQLAEKEAYIGPVAAYWYNMYSI